MGRVEDAPKRRRVGTHSTWPERPRLQRCWTGSGRRPRERRPGAPMLRRIFRSTTFGNGAGFPDVLGPERPCLSQGKRVDLCYAHPCSSSERGANEVHNGIIRRFLPKGTGFARAGRPRIREAARRMDTCPRGILGGDTPAEAFGRES